MTTTAPPRIDRAAFNARRAEQMQKARDEAAPRFSARHKYVLVVLLGLAAFMSIASFSVSFSGLFGAAEWAIGDKTPWLQAAAPLMVDVSIICFTLKLFVNREEGEPVFWTWVWIGVLASVSAASNVVHALSVTTAQTLPQLIVGCVIAGGAPFLLALVIDVAAGLVFQRPKGKRQS